MCFYEMFYRNFLSLNVLENRFFFVLLLYFINNNFFINIFQDIYKLKVLILKYQLTENVLRKI